MIPELILIGENWHRSTLNPVIFSVADLQVLGEERYWRAGHEQTLRNKTSGYGTLLKADRLHPRDCPHVSY